MHTAVRRSSSLNSTGVKNEQPKNNRKKESLRRCKSTPDKKPARQSRETNSDVLKCCWDKERGHVTDLIAGQQPNTNQPQLSYFAYLGNSYPSKRRYNAVSSDAEAIISLGSDICAQNRCPSSMTNSDEWVVHGNDVNKSAPIKLDTTRLLECCSCMCCVKAIFYHCTKNEDFQRNWADQPCSCETGSDCGTRWGILGMFSLFLPCLVCYPIIKVCCKFPFNLTKGKS